jgi:hypothetical protein
MRAGSSCTGTSLIVTDVGGGADHLDPVGVGLPRHADAVL